MPQRINLDIDVLRTFVLGFELGSFARAADRVGRSQSAVSTQLRKLEEQIGQPLVKKAGRGLALTAAGENLLGYARRILDLNDQAIESMREAELAGTVRLGLPQDFAERWLAEVLARFAFLHPKVQVEVRAENVVSLVEKTTRGELDMSLCWGASINAPHVEPIARIPVVWIGRADSAPRLAAGEALPMVVFEPPCAFRDPAVVALDRAGIAWRVAFTSPSLSSLWSATAAGLGVTVRTRVGMPADLIVLHPDKTGLPPLPDVSLSLMRADKAQSPTVASLMNILRGVIRERLDKSTMVGDDA